ncbi:MAG TPA: M1 family metallopeptidase [Edaphocola sp.]|nr:M1 family metallopeptidase [Edaphocola sp.]
MRKFYLYLSLMGIFFALSSCRSQHSLSGQGPAQSAVVASSYDSLPYRPTPSKAWELIHTGINIAFDIPARIAQATTQIILHPHFYATDSVVLDAKSMKILSVSGAGKNSLPYRYDGLQLHINLPEAYTRSDTLTLNIHYIAMPYAAGGVGGKAITEDRGLYFINADHFEPYQPVQIWTQGETEANSHWFPTFDHTNFRSTFTITMHVPDSFRTLSNGRLMASKEEPGNMRADTWQQEVPIPPYLAMMAASNFAVVSDRNSKAGKAVDYYVPQEYKDYARDIFKYTPEMIDFFSKKLKMDYPWSKYSQVIGYDYVSGAMENVSASLFGAFNLKDSRQIADDNNDFIVAHELFHQWFGDYVTCENWSQITLNESFADFSEKLWAEYKYGEDEAEIEFYNSKLRYLGQAPYSDLPLVRFRFEHPDDVFDRVSYSKGGMILNYLRRQTGDSAFFAALHLYLSQNALQSTEADQLRLAFEKVTGKDWHVFFNQWYDKGGHPILDIRYKYDDDAKKMTVFVKQVQQEADYQTAVYYLPLKAQIIRDGQIETIDWLVDSSRQTFAFPYKGDYRPVFIPDAGHWLPGEIQDHKDFNQWARQYFSAGLRSTQDFSLAKQAGFEALDDMDLMSRFDALIGIFAQKGSVADDQIDSVLKTAIQKDPSGFIRGNALRLLVQMKIPVSQGWKNFFYALAQNDHDNKVRAAAIDWLGKNDNKQYADFFEKATEASSYYVAASALTALNQVNHHRAETIARDLISKNGYSAKWLTAAGNVIAGNGNPDDYSFYSNILWHKYEGDRALFMGSFAAYLRHVTDDSTFNRGLALMKKMADKEGEGSRFQIQMFSHVYHLYKQLSMKTAAQKNAGQKSAAAKRVWDDYKQSVQNENTRKQIRTIEMQYAKAFGA